MAGDAPSANAPTKATTELAVANAPAKDAPTVAKADSGNSGAVAADEKGHAANSGEAKDNAGEKKQDDAAQSATDETGKSAGEQKESAAAAGSKSAKKAAATPRLSKKKSSVNMKGKGTPKKTVDVNLKFEPGNHVMAKMRSYPPWPAIILNQELLPGLLKDGPPKGGKTAPSEAWKTHYPVMFLGTLEYAWTSIADLDPIPEDRKKEPKKSKALANAFEDLERGFNLEDVKEVQEHAITRDDEAEDTMDVDEEEPEESEEEPVKKKPGKKRKVSSDEDDTTPEKPAKTPKKDKKTPKSTTKYPKTPSNGVTKSGAKGKASDKKASSKGEKKTTPAASSKRDLKAKSAERVQTDSDDDSEEKTVDPSTLTQKAQFDLMMHRRHKLQKAFLNKEGTMPTGDEMPTLNKCLTSLEEWPSLSAELISTTKINKVLKGIIKLPAIPMDLELKFRSRSASLYEKWNGILGSSDKFGKKNGVSAEKPQEKTENTEKPTANGEKADKDGDVDMKAESKPTDDKTGEKPAVKDTEIKEEAPKADEKGLAKAEETA